MAKPRKRRQQAGTNLPIPVWIAGLVGIILLAAGLVVLTGQQRANPSPSTVPYPDVPRISPAEAHGQQQAGTGVIIDVRDAAFYQEAHAAGALSVPEDELLAQLDNLPTDKTLIFY
jgi:hypothetical protein